jgi:cytochrome c oxidase subunit IV
MTVEVQSQNVQDTEKQALNKRLESIGWALFLIMLGCSYLVDPTRVASGIWSIAVGVILLGLNAARYANGIRMSGFTVFLGLISVITGVAEVLGANLPIFPILLIIFGANIILKPWFEKQGLFEQKAESEASGEGGTSGVNVGRMVGGIVCTAIGGLLAILTFVLPENQTMFMIGDANVPIVPAAILIVIGVALLATAKKQ